MISHPSTAVHVDKGNEPVVTLLKSPDFGLSSAENGELPYRLDLLRAEGLRLAWSDAHLRLEPRWLRRVERLEQRAVPFLQALQTRQLRRGAYATMAIFESEGHGLALWRRLSGRRRPPLLIVGCWLADVARGSGPARRLLYRFLYQAVDAVVVFSSNQHDTLVELLGIEPSRIHVVRFGVDLEELSGVPVRDGGGIAAVGRDLGRDWSTLCAAADGSGWKVELVTRASQVQGLTIPAEVTVHGRMDRAAYLELLACADVVVVPTEVREYPTGQTVLLEAMAMGKACVVTDTPAMREYVADGVTAMMVPPHDAAALRTAVDRLLADHDLRRRIGASARAVEQSHGGARVMWQRVAELLCGVPPT
jgi:glycosyltransferase involved in cell wall biosynthesis